MKVNKQKQGPVLASDLWMTSDFWSMIETKIFTSNMTRIYSDYGLAWIWLNLKTQVALWVKPQSLELADQKVGGSNPRDGVSSRLVPAPANLAVQKHVKVQVDK